MDFCRSFGLKKAGIISAKEGKFTCEVTNTVYLSTVLAKDGEILVSDEYLAILLDIANKKLENNFKTLELFTSSFLSSFL